VLGRVRLPCSAIILGLIGQSRQAQLVREQGQTRPGIAPVGRHVVWIGGDEFRKVVVAPHRELVEVHGELDRTGPIRAKEPGFDDRVGQPVRRALGRANELSGRLRTQNRGDVFLPEWDQPILVLSRKKHASNPSMKKALHGGSRARLDHPGMTSSGLQRTRQRNMLPGLADRKLAHALCQGVQVFS
jgi:hypothetical protein